MAVIGALVAIPDAGATTVTSRFKPDADAFVSQVDPNANFGMSPTLRTSAIQRTQRSYLRFDVSQLPGTVVRARLRLFAERRDRVGYAVRSVASSNWTENRITDANAPALGPVVSTFGPVDRDSWTSADVTPVVRGPGRITLALTAVGASVGVYASRETGPTAPQLEVETLTTGGVMATSATFRIMTTVAATTTSKATTTTATATTTTVAPTTTTTTTTAPSSLPTGLATAADFRGPGRYGIAAGCCIQYLSSTELARQLDDYKALGVRWLRFDMAWSGVQAGGRDSYNWAPYDALVRAANSRGIRLLGMIGYTPAWARPASCNGDDKCAPANVNDFALFAGQTARRYGPLGLHAWEIWNEQNGSVFWKPAPSPSLYTAMLKASYKAIKASDPDAWVLTGGLTPAYTSGGNLSPVDFLTDIYRYGAKGSFDAVGAHPYCWAGSFDCPGQEASWSAWSQMSSTQSSLRSILLANGDQGKLIWGTEFGAPTAGGQHAVSEDGQARQLLDGYSLFGSYNWTGPLFWYSYRDACRTTGDTECYFGLVRSDGSHKPAYAAYQQSIRSAS